MLAWKLKKLGYHMDTNTRTITIPHRKLPDWFTWFIVWLLNAYWIRYVLLGIVLTWMGFPALLSPIFWFIVLKFFLPIASLTSLPGLLLGYTQVVVVVHNENDKDEQTMATIHIQHYRRWAYTPLIMFLSLLMLCLGANITGEIILEDRTISVPLRGAGDSCDKNVQLVGYEHEIRPGDLSWNYEISVVPPDEDDENETVALPDTLTTDNEEVRMNILKRIRRQKKLGKMVVLSLLGWRQEKRVQRGLYLTQVLNMWCHADYNATDHHPPEEEEAMTPMMTSSTAKTTSPASSSSLRSRMAVCVIDDVHFDRRCRANLFVCPIQLFLYTSTSSLCLFTNKTI